MHTLVRFAALLILSSWSTATLSWDAAATLPPGETPSPVIAQSALWLPGDGAWIYGENGELIRLRHGRAIRAELPSWFGAQRTQSLADTTPDGGALVYGDDCRLVRYTPEGRVRWRGEHHCNELAMSASDGTSWATRLVQEPGDPPFVRHIAADGSALPVPAETVQQLGPYEVEPYRFLFRVPNAGDVFHIGAVTAGAGTRYVRVLRLDTTGRVLWHWQHDAAWRIGSTHASVTPEGDILLAGNIGDTGNASRSTLQVVRLGADGRVRWINRSAVSDVGGSALRATGDGGAVVLSQTTAPDDQFVLKLAADGSIAWRKTVEPLYGTYDRSLPFLAEAADGSLIVIARGVHSFENGLRFLRLGTDGSLRIARDIGFGQALPNGDALVLANPAPPYFVRISELGERVATDYADATVPTEMEPAASASSADGSQFVLAIDRHASHDRPKPHFTLSKVDADGRIAWQRDTADEVTDAQLGANAQRVCSYTRRQRIAPSGYGAQAGIVECFAAATGTTVWSREVRDHVPGAYSLTVLPDDRLVITTGLAMSHLVEILGADGRTQQTTIGNFYALKIATSPKGYVAVVLNTDLSNADNLVVYGPDTQRRYSLPRSALNFAHNPRALAISDEGAIAVYGHDPGANDPPDSSRGVIYSTEPVANRSWRTVLPAMRDNGWAATLEFAGTALLVAQRRKEESNGTSQDMRTAATRLSSLDRSSGNLRWQHDSINVASLRHAMAVSADGERLVSVHGERRRLRVEQFDRRTGERLLETWRDCNALECDPVRLINGRDGRSRLVARVQTVDKGSGVAVYTERAFDAPPPTIRMDQPGIAGAWWSPYAHGEGIALDWLPASRTLFGAWFTYSTSGGNEPAELRWYTVQASGIDVDARTLELPILETVGGNFDAAPGVSPRRVGSARIAFRDCARATLDYTFDEPTNEGRHGTIVLSRLSPATQPCVLADGSSVPGDGARPPSGGFDAKFSGTWFDEAKAGQGLQFTVQPGGVFFAPWFTFDPADTGNDPGRQHWFTLQGNLAEAGNGTVQLVLVQTIGGSFDLVPTYNTTAVGSATLRMQGCDRAELDYRFDDTSGAGAFRARNGTLRLARAGGCAP